MFAFGVGLLASTSAARPETVPHGTEFQVNSYTSGGQGNARVDAAGNGSFIVVWTSFHDGQDSVFAQRFDSSGARVGTEFQVNTYTATGQEDPAVAADEDGDFVVVWSSYHDGGEYGVFGQRFDASGARQAVEFQINAYTLGEQGDAVVTMRSGGEFVVVWRSQDQDGYGRGVFGRRFDVSGAAQGVEFQVNTSTTGYQGDPALALNADGSFVVVWQGYDQDGSQQGIIGQRFSATATRQGTEFVVNTETDLNQNSPEVAVDGSGRFVAVWQSYHDGSSVQVLGQRFNSVGQRLGAEFVVSPDTQYEQIRPSLARQATGEFVVVWDATRNGTNQDVLARRFSATGVPLSGEFKVNTRLPESQYSADVSTNRNGGFVMVWQSQEQDGAFEGVFGQLYLRNLVLDVDGDGIFNALTDGILILRFGFEFHGGLLTSGAVGDECTRCTAEDIEAYLGAI